MFVTKGSKSELLDVLQTRSKEFFIRKGQWHPNETPCSKSILQISLPTEVSTTCPVSYTCIEARDRIFDCCLLRNSAPTTPLILVPKGSPFLPINAHALSSNLTVIPSFLCTFFAVLTTIACLISPLRTLFAAATDVLPPGPLSPIDRDFCTTTIMRSPKHCSRHEHSTRGSQGVNVPILACLFMRTFATHSTMVAPELSMQLSIVCSGSH